MEVMWTRPASAPFPCFRRRCEGTRAVDGAGSKSPPTYIIQEVPDDRHEEAIRIMADVLARDEPVSIAFGLLDNPQALDELKYSYRLLLSQRMSVCAMVEQPDGSAGPIVAVNLLMVAQPDDLDKLKGKDEKLLRALAGVKKMEGSLSPDVYTRYGVPAYLSSMGLVVVPEHRGQGLGEALLRARWDVGRAAGVRLTASSFTGFASQKVARRAGFETLCETRYADNEDPALRAVEGAPSYIFMAATIN